MYKKRALAAAISVLSIASMATSAHAEDRANVVKIGYAGLYFNTESGELAGPPGATPPGVKLDLEDTELMAVSYQRYFSDRWSVMLQAGMPPVVNVDGAGSAAALGRAAQAKVWFPALLITYNFADWRGFRPYVGAGVNYTFFTDRQVSSAYTSQVGGVASTLDLKESWGPVLRLGVEYPITENLVVDLSYLHYGMDTTATITTDTPGFGNVVRTVDVEANPDVLGLVVGYRF